MKIGSISENKDFEKRIAITPEIAKKYISLDLEVLLVENYGAHLGYNDDEYKKEGVNIIKDEKEVLDKSDVIVQLALLADDKASLVKENKTLIGVLNPSSNKDKIESLAKKKIIVNNQLILFYLGMMFLQKVTDIVFNIHFAKIFIYFFV